MHFTECFSVLLAAMLIFSQARACPPNSEDFNRSSVSFHRVSTFTHAAHFFPASGFIKKNKSNAGSPNEFRVTARADPPDEDPIFTPPDYNRPASLFMPNNNGPMFRSGWDPGHCNDRVRAQKAFFDAMLLAEASYAYMYDYARGKNDGSSFTRYFAPGSLWIVANVTLNTIFNAKRLGTADQDLDGSLWNPLLKYLDVRYGALPLGTLDGRFDMHCRIDNTGQIMNAVFAHGEYFAPGMIPWRGFMLLCPRAFVWPDLPAITDKSKCPRLEVDRFQSFAQRTLASIIFHELLHDQALNGNNSVPALGSNPILDYRKAEDSSASSAYPSSGYGVWQAMQLKQASSQNNRAFLPVLNADSYTVFANEAWWSVHCGVEFEDPPDEYSTLQNWIPSTIGPWGHF